MVLLLFDEALLNLVAHSQSLLWVLSVPLFAVGVDPPSSNRGIDDSPGDRPVVDGEFDCPLSNLALHSQGELGDCGGIMDESPPSFASPGRRRCATLALASTRRASRGGLRTP